MRLYDQDGLLNINKQRKIPVIFLTILSAVFVTVFVLSIVLSRYKTQTIFIVVTSIVLLLITFGIIFFACKLSFLTNLSKEYAAILQAEKKSYKGLVTGYDDRIITLADGSKVKQALIKINNQERIFYLSFIFEEDIEINKEISFETAFDYIVWWKYEDQLSFEEPSK